MGHSRSVVAALVLLACGSGAAQAAQPWEQPGTQVGQEIVGPDEGTMVWVPAGTFRMGSTRAELAAAQVEFLFLDHRVQRLDDELQPHRVRLDGFWLSKHEVTNAQYRAFCAATGREFTSEGYQGDQHPVIWVSWEDATAYCDHYGLTLPTEAQWEYAARGPERRVFPWGDEWDPAKLCTRGNRGPGGTTFPVGSFPGGGSWCGALDLAGNVLEWCADGYDPTYYRRSPARNPIADPVMERVMVVVIERVVIQCAGYRVVRGGSWYSGYAMRFRGAFRDSAHPAASGDICGFRCARMVP